MPDLLGSGDVVRSGAGAKAANLDRAAAGGIAVPRGFVLGHRPLGVDDDGVEQADRVLVADALAGLGDRVAVRSAFSAEDTSTSAMAGHFATELDVAATVDDVIAAVERVRDSASRWTDAAGHVDLRCDVLVMAMVDAERAGVVFTEQQFEDDIVEVVDGLADSLVSGHEAGTRRTVPKLRRFERHGRLGALRASGESPGPEPWLTRLTELLRSVRETFGERDWDIEWADDGERCWLVQIRPITAAPRRDETFTIANHKEILPELPSVLMASVVEASAYELMDYYRAIDPTLPVDRPFIESFAGRPYINLSQLTDLLRRLGLPTRLLSESLGGEPELLVGVNPVRIVRSTPALIRLGFAQLGAVGSARRAEHEIAARVAVPASTFADGLESLQAVYVELVTQMSSLATAMTAPVALLRAAGTLDAHVGSQRTPGTKMLDDIAPLARLAGDETRRAELEAGRLPSDPTFQAAWADWVSEHGHRGVFESDIARPRFADDPAPIIASILTHRSRAGEKGKRRSVRQLVTWPLWAFARRPMAARERIRWSTMQAFAELRSQLVALADRAVEAGRLPEATAIWDLSMQELIEVGGGRVVSREELESRRALVEERAAMRLPDLVRRFDDLAELAGAPRRDGERVLRGVSLTSGVVEGRALRASEPPSRLPDGYEPESTVLVARSVDAGWVPIFGQVAGVAVEIGGDLSHGSIILRELGLPAATNLGDVGSLASGDRVRLDAGAGRLERLDPLASHPASPDPSSPDPAAPSKKDGDL